MQRGISSDTTLVLVGIFILPVSYLPLSTIIRGSPFCKLVSSGCY